MHLIDVFILCIPLVNLSISHTCFEYFSYFRRPFWHPPKTPNSAICWNIFDWHYFYLIFLCSSKTKNWSIGSFWKHTIPWLEKKIGPKSHLRTCEKIKVRLQKKKSKITAFFRKKKKDHIYKSGEKKNDFFFSRFFLSLFLQVISIWLMCYNPTIDQILTMITVL